MPIQNNPPITTDAAVNDMRSAIEHRATWMYLLLDEAEKAGLPWEEFARRAIRRCGEFHGRTKFTPTTDLCALAREFSNPLYSKIFEMDVKEASASRFEVHFHYCPLVAAWKKQTTDEKKMDKLCDIAMDGDRGIASAFPAFDVSLGETIAKGDRFCRIMFKKR